MPNVLGVKEAIKEARERAGLSQKALAERAGVSQRTIAYAEDGRDLKLSTARAIADVLGLTLDELLPPENGASK